MHVSLRRSAAGVRGAELADSWAEAELGFRPPSTVASGARARRGCAGGWMEGWPGKFRLGSRETGEEARGGQA